MPSPSIDNNDLIALLRKENALFLKKVRAIALERDRKLMEIIRRIEADKMEKIRVSIKR